MSTVLVRLAFGSIPRFAVVSAGVSVICGVWYCCVATLKASGNCKASIFLFTFLPQSFLLAHRPLQSSFWFVQSSKKIRGYENVRVTR